MTDLNIFLCRPYYCYFPFSLGPRSCIGQVFAQVSKGLERCCVASTGPAQGMLAVAGVGGTKGHTWWRADPLSSREKIPTTGQVSQMLLREHMYRAGPLSPVPACSKGGDSRLLSL